MFVVGSSSVITLRAKIILTCIMHPQALTLLYISNQILPNVNHYLTQSLQDYNRMAYKVHISLINDSKTIRKKSHFSEMLFLLAGLQ